MGDTKEDAELDDELDAILDQALDDFEKEEFQPVSIRTPAPQEPPTSPPAETTNDSPSSEDLPPELLEIENMMKSLLKDLQVPTDGNTDESDEIMEKVMSDLSEALREGAPPPDDSTLDEFQQNIRNTLRMVSESAQRLQESDDTDGLHGAGLADMLNQVLGTNPSESDLGNMLESFAHQLMNKNVLYGPMKQISDEYPTWFARNESNTAISAEQMAKYRKQYGLFQELVGVYETAPDDYSAISPIMEEISALGQPPDDLLELLAHNNNALPNLDQANCVVM